MSVDDELRANAVAQTGRSSTHCKRVVRPGQLQANCLDVYLTEWGELDEVDAGNTLETYCDEQEPTISLFRDLGFMWRRC